VRMMTLVEVDIDAVDQAIGSRDGGSVTELPSGRWHNNDVFYEVVDKKWKVLSQDSSSEETVVSSVIFFDKTKLYVANSDVPSLLGGHVLVHEDSYMALLRCTDCQLGFPVVGA